MRNPSFFSLNRSRTPYVNIPIPVRTAGRQSKESRQAISRINTHYMKTFLRSNQKTHALKYIIFLIIGLILFTVLAIIPSINPIFRALLLIVIGINAISDIVYIYRERQYVKKLSFADDRLLVNWRDGTEEKTPYKYLMYSIRKKKFHKSWTEIELKGNASNPNSTFARLHIKNWDDIFEIEQQLKDLNIKESAWEPRSLWERYGEFILMGIEILGGILEWLSVFV